MSADRADGHHWNGFLRGEEKSFEALYNQYYESLVGYAAKLSNDQTFIEEAVQDLFVKLWKNRENLSQPVSVKHYLFKALRNLILNKFRIAKKEISIGSEADLLAFELQYSLLHMHQESEDWSYLTRALLDDLTDRQKEAVYLFYAEGMTYKEIADLLKINIGGTYKLMYRAISRIREKANALNAGDKRIVLPAKT